MKNESKPKVEDLLSSKEFKDIVNGIIRSFCVRRDDLKDDVEQTCAMVVMRKIKTYDASRNASFWTYCLPFMTEYAKREIIRQRNVVHIPYNHINSSFKNYSKISHEYIDLCMPDGNPIPLAGQQSDLTLMIDIHDAIEELDDLQKNVLKMRIGVIPTNNGKYDFTSIGQTLGISMQKARLVFNQARETIKKKINAKKS